ncbi:hypothetical protein V9T40_003244 [Parthenolecanium corni]|uniref:RNA helicase n=1 Tax=Parthenolecanium corni TaxID=536013 RepID=A0AAN9YA87_9HEMI
MSNPPVGVVGFDDSESKDEASIALKKRKKSGGFQLMGLSYPVLKGVLKRGYKVPTPIQRKAIPVALEGRDIVAMAKTGSGKTASFLLPMFEKLKEHSGSGFRALILSPTRELALQTYKFIKELGRFTTLRPVIILGGDSMDSQFSSLHGNPDIVVATPGRFLHLCVEMELKMSCVQYVVFDEADRLFEMGFSEQLTEILQRLPENRQTLLFSATLPKVLVQFAKAGLNDPILIRLDLESKIPDTLELEFFHCRPEEREAGLLCLLKHVIEPDRMTIVFAATKHHVEFLHFMLTQSGIDNTYIYSDLDPAARKINAAKFQSGKVKVLVVTDVAARGIDIPQLDYVINFNFPAKPKLFVHRVGRCARAGRKGEAFSLVTTDELCYLLDLHLFLGRPLSMVTSEEKVEAGKDGYFGRIPQTLIEEELSAFISWSDTCCEIAPMKKVCNNGYKNYIKSRPGASKDSVRRAKNIDVEKMRIHPLFAKICHSESKKFEFINKVKNYKPKTTIFELGQSSSSVMSLSTRLFRKMNQQNVENFHRKKEEAKGKELQPKASSTVTNLEKSNVEDIEDTFQEVITQRKRRKLKTAGDEQESKKRTKIDLENYVPYKPSDEHYEKGLAIDELHAKSSHGILDLIGDSTDMMRNQKRTEKKWDPAKKKYVANNNKEKMIRSESGQWIPASMKSGRYEKWQERTKARQTEESDDDDESNKPAPSSMRLNTHWSRHNLKVSQKQQKPQIDINLERILKQRKIKEKRRQRNGRKPNKTKFKKKSAKFNKV